MPEIRTRFAPSPTGFMHVGAARTALFAWLVARQSDGKFILRIEDTDKAREVSGAEEHIINSLKWLGIDWDEGPDIGGKYGPYRQSERLAVYNTWAQKLISNGKAYADPYSPKEIEHFRSLAKQAKQPFLFRNHRPDNPPEWDNKTPLRLKSTPKTYEWQDKVIGKLSSGPEVIDDFILIKSDGYPTYNFCHIIDDYLMNISYIIRSQEFISSVPKYLNLYEALGFTPPIMATLPFVMAIDGNKKLGKRDGAKDILDYSRDGYLPEAMMNFLATLGWNDGTENEIFSKTDLVSGFSLKRVQKSAARFDEKRLLWMDGYWLRNMDCSELYKRSDSHWPINAEKYDVSYKKNILGLIQERLKYLGEIPALTSFFFEDPRPNLELIKSNKKLKNIDKTDLVSYLKTTCDSLTDIEFNIDSISQILNDLLIKTGQKPAILFGIIRLATTWSPASPALADTLQILGKEKTLTRIQKSIDFLS
ncbi:MAG: glutamate--tRNA ligase [Candidatus Saccharibacteria bacterium]